MIGHDLYKRGYSRALLNCITKEQAKYVLGEIHEGACGNHSGARTMAAKVLRVGYFWPTVQSDCAKYVKKCTKCQEYDPLSHFKPDSFHNMVSPCHSPFREWTSSIPSAWAKNKQNFPWSGWIISPNGSMSSPSPPSWPRMSKVLCAEALYVGLEFPTPS